MRRILRVLYCARVESTGLCCVVLCCAELSCAELCCDVL